MSDRILLHLQPEAGAGRRFWLSRRRLRALVALAALTLVALAGGGAYGGWVLHERLGNGPSARAENALLRSRLEEVEARQERVDRALDRVMAYDSKIRQLTRHDDGARAFGIGPLTELEIAAAERDGRGVELPGEELELPQTGDVAVVLDDLELRAQDLDARVAAEEVSLQEVRGYLEDRSSLLRAAPSAWPVRGWVTSGFGYRDSPTSGGRRLHAGIDIAAPRGTPIIAAADGHVVFSGYHSAYGNLLVLDHGYGLVTRYAHTSRLLAKVGDHVQRGQLVALVGNTGRSTGPHLHFEVYQDGVAVNPRKFLQLD